MVQSGKFREDLFYRFNVCPIIIPPLRERKEDIPALVHYFVERKSKEMGLHLPPELASGSMERLMNHEWPGNVRELKNIVKQGVVISENKILDLVGWRKTSICVVVLILRHCDVRKSTPHSSGFRAPCI